MSAFFILEPIALNAQTVVCPFIDVVAYDTFEYRAQDEGARGAFDCKYFCKKYTVGEKRIRQTALYGVKLP